MTPRRVLIVDDDPTFTTLLRHGLEKHGWLCTCAENARMALELALETPVDAIVMDLHMPGINGIDAMEVLNDHGLSRIPKLLVTSDESPRAKAVALSKDAVNVLHKPVDFSIVIQAIDRAIEQCHGNAAQS